MNIFKSRNSIIAMLTIIISILYLAEPYNVQSEAKSTEAVLVEMFKYAKVHDVGSLEKMRSTIESIKDRKLMAAYSLALFIASHKKYKQQYVDNFPSSAEEIDFITKQVELRKLTPSFLYFIDAIDGIAEEGNEKAIERVIIGIGQTDGGAAELLCDTLSRLFANQLQKTITALSKYDKELREKSYICFELMDDNQIKALRSKLIKLDKISTMDKDIVQELIVHLDQ